MEPPGASRGNITASDISNVFHTHFPQHAAILPDLRQAIRPLDGCPSSWVVHTESDRFLAVVLVIEHGADIEKELGSRTLSHVTENRFDAAVRAWDAHRTMLDIERLDINTEHGYQDFCCFCASTIEREGWNSEITGFHGMSSSLRCGDKHDYLVLHPWGPT